VSENQPDRAFWDRADAIIHLANEQCSHAPNGEASASLLYAAARFNAFIVAVNASSAKEIEADKDRAIEHFVGQYKKMLVENLDDHIENFERYSAEEGT
jgi:hypothetical protein